MLRCLGAVRDDLHDYAEEIHARLAEHLEAMPVAYADFGNFDGIVLHRRGWFQAELISVMPGAFVPPHVHPETDSVDILVEGNVAAFHIGRHKIRSFTKGLGLRIPAMEVHGATVAHSGVAFVSCQRWQRPPTHIALDWRGQVVAPMHGMQLASEQ